jgi:hypothetical protein
MVIMLTYSVYLIQPKNRKRLHPLDLREREKENNHILILD